MPYFGRIFSSWNKAEGGSAALEFAFAAPVVIFAMVGLLELAALMFVSSLVEGGLREASRFGITGFVPNGISREERIRQIVAANTIGLVDLSTATITQTIYPGFGDIAQPEPFQDQQPFNGAYDAGEPYQDINGNGQWDADMGVAGVGGPGDVVLYTLEVDWPALTPLFQQLYNAAGPVRLTASAVVRNEPFGTPGPLAQATP